MQTNIEGLKAKIAAADRAGDTTQAAYYRGLLRLQQQADQAGPESSASAATILGSLDSVVQRMRALGKDRK